MSNLFLRFRMLPSARPPVPVSRVLFLLVFFIFLLDNHLNRISMSSQNYRLETRYVFYCCVQKNYPALRPQTQLTLFDCPSTLGASVTALVYCFLNGSHGKFTCIYIIIIRALDLHLEYL